MRVLWHILSTFARAFLIGRVAAVAAPHNPINFYSSHYRHAQQMMLPFPVDSCFPITCPLRNHTYQCHLSQRLNFDPSITHGCIITRGFYATPAKAADGLMNLMEWEFGIRGR
ncbi:hypothetical protein B0H13DRAFT_1856204 [Mycena leptocephala]|nr:hypothetical protein B0H13DRAFT_1856204 [Mycena leptocephala]